uniref:Uncharacterized protein n=1 Tax=Oryza barthii TaxID=65489 RepID=A0A0D3GXG0_9ORYZ
MVTATVAAVADERGDCGGIGRGRGRLWWSRAAIVTTTAATDKGSSAFASVARAAIIGSSLLEARPLYSCSNLFWHYLSLSLLCVKLFKDGVLQTKIRDKDDPRLSKMRKEVVAGGKDAMEVDNDFFLVPVKISDHQLQTSSQNKKKDKAAVFRSCPFHFYNAKNTAEICRAHDEHQCKKFNSYGK